MTFNDYLKRYHTMQTVACYSYHVDAYLLRHPTAYNSSYDEIAQYISEYSDNRNSGTHLAAVKRYYDYLIEQGVREDHPCRNIMLHKKRKAIQIHELFSPEELEVLLSRENRYANLLNRNKVVVSLMIYQALTPSELCKLNCADIDLDAGTIHIKRGAKNSSRTLDLVPQQILLIQNYLTSNRKKMADVSTTKFLITIRGANESTDGINSIIEPLKHLYPGRTLNPSTIRKSVIANRLNISKQPLEDVQLFAGHKWPSTTELYKTRSNSDQVDKINLWHPLR
jgi:site-specific recombinase XerD